MRFQDFRQETDPGITTEGVTDAPSHKIPNYFPWFLPLRELAPSATVHYCEIYT
jgi:hypothetical protein